MENRIGIIVGTLVGVTLAVLTVKNWSKIKKGVSAIEPKIKEIGAKAKEGYKHGYEQGYEKVSGLVGSAVEASKNLVEKVMPKKEIEAPVKSKRPSLKRAKVRTA